MLIRARDVTSCAMTRRRGIERNRRPGIRTEVEIERTKRELVAEIVTGLEVVTKTSIEDRIVTDPKIWTETDHNKHHGTEAVIML